MNLLMRHLLDGWEWTGGKPTWAAGMFWVPMRRRGGPFLGMAPGEAEWSRTFRL